jgi:hypothetical protein
VTRPELHGCELKIARANEHLSALEAEALRFPAEHDPCELALESDLDSGWHTLGVTRVEELPPEWGVIVGDIAHNLHSALDHLVWQLVLANGEKPGAWTYFPIISEEGDFLRRAICPSDDKRAMLHGLDWRGEAVAMIERLQPYNTPKGVRRLHPLRILNAVSNADKHRVVHAGLTAFWSATPTVSVDPVGPGMGVQVILPDGAKLVEHDVRIRPRQTIVGGTEILRFRVEPADTHVEVQTDLGINPVFKAENSSAMIQQLHVIADRVDEIIKTFEPFFK